jgi:pimeloyl-ACP methyl ester carboxylesterase
MAPASPQKSTIVRIKNAGLRAFFRTADLVAPRAAGRVARDLWFSVPPAMAAAPLPAGGEPFTVTAQGSAVRGHVFGEGPVVYLVHGWAGRGSQLAAFVEPLVSAGHRVVLFDAPAHGDSDHGPAGPRRTHGVEFGKALDAVFARFGPAEAVVAHSLGTISTYLSLRFGWLGTRRLVLLAPMVAAGGLVDEFQEALGFGSRTRRAFEREVEGFVGIPLAEFDARVQAEHVEPVPTLVLHDLGDRQAPYVDAQRLVRALPDARLVTTDGLRHRRILGDPEVVTRVVEFVSARERAEAA